MDTNHCYVLAKDSRLLHKVEVSSSLFLLVFQQNQGQLEQKGGLSFPVMGCLFLS